MPSFPFHRAGRVRCGRIRLLPVLTSWNWIRIRDLPQRRKPGFAPALKSFELQYETRRSQRALNFPSDATEYQLVDFTTALPISSPSNSSASSR